MKKLLLNKGQVLISIVFFCLISNIYADNPSAQQKPKSLLQQIVDSYVNSSKTNSALKNLLDAKMYLSTAEHDLLVSHDKESAKNDIKNTLNYLLEAEKVAQPNIKQQLVSLVDTIKGLEQKTANIAESGNNNETDKLLAIANTDLAKAKQNATPITQIEIEKIMTSINTLRRQIEQANLREDYESAMHMLSRIINNL